MYSVALVGRQRKARAPSLASAKSGSPVHFDNQHIPRLGFTVVSNSPSNCLITFWCLLRETCARHTCTYAYDISYIRRLHIFIFVIVCIRCHTARLESSPYDTWYIRPLLLYQWSYVSGVIRRGFLLVVWHLIHTTTALEKWDRTWFSGFGFLSYLSKY